MRPWHRVTEHHEGTIDGDRSTGSAAACRWRRRKDRRIEATWVAAGTCGRLDRCRRWKIDGDRLTNAKKQSATTDADGLKEGRLCADGWNVSMSMSMIDANEIRKTDTAATSIGVSD